MKLCDRCFNQLKMDLKMQFQDEQKMCYSFILSFFLYFFLSEILREFDGKYRDIRKNWEQLFFSFFLCSFVFFFVLLFIFLFDLKKRKGFDYNKNKIEKKIRKICGKLGEIKGK